MPLNVSSLCTEFANHKGILAVAHNPRSDLTKVPTWHCILDLLKLVLHGMNFEFSGDHYLGVTAVGTSQNISTGQTSTNSHTRDQ